LGEELRVEPEVAEHGHRAEDGLDPGPVIGPEQRAADLDGVGAEADAIDVRLVADLAADLRLEVGLDVLGATLLEQGVS
jgi:hypothetical protein